jgi:hypothetical protein
MRKFLLSVLSLGVFIAAQPASAQMMPHAQEGEMVTMTATVVDMSCKVVFDLEGDDHRMCAQVCFDQGVPLGLMSEEGEIFLPVTMKMGMERGDKDLKGHAEHTVTVTGKVMDRGGVKAILIESIKMEEE